MSNVAFSYYGEKATFKIVVLGGINKFKEITRENEGKAKLEGEDNSDANVIDRADVLEFTTLLRAKILRCWIHLHPCIFARTRIPWTPCTDMVIIVTFHNVKHVPSAGVNLISLGEITPHGYKYVVVHKWCKAHKGEKDKKNICHLIGCSLLGTTHGSKWLEKRKRVRLWNDVEIFRHEPKTLVVPPK
ncbi:LOW QUALITY PROTEIN: hypothetical protein Cgig2_012240 [Carnegiea gigantea]|uniref:Uncharacterized protein n=1 Tax=Carnegiea gigantea TaxID=171969 RepID=A0A9Q1GYM1_9CARY|nr:LOW QUALITY PROTEIN: hypothetical protein Cgig2_012240 [Carnegiea gigantea]